jgi:hypothetical protein
MIELGRDSGFGFAPSATGQRDGDPIDGSGTQ